MTNNNPDTAHVTLPLPHGRSVRCYVAYRPGEGPDGGDWAARFDLLTDGDDTAFGWKADHAAKFVADWSDGISNGEARNAVRCLEKASFALQFAEQYATPAR